MDAEKKGTRPQVMARTLIDAYFEGGLPEDLDRKLMGWIVGRMGTEPVDEAVFAKWLDMARPGAQPDRETVEAFDQAMQQLDFPEEVRVRLSDSNKVPSTALPVRKPVPLRRRIVLRAAAVLIPVFIAAGAMWMWVEGASDHTPGFVAEVTVSVTDGLRKQLTLSDNSEVWVNSGGKLEYSGEAGDKRLAKLDGEAYFRVERNEAKPFIVSTPHAEIEVLGTEFNVNTSGEGGVTEVALARGSVSVKAGRETHTLSPGQMLVYDHLTDNVVVRNVDASSLNDWWSPVMNLSNRPLREILAVVADYYDMELSVEGDLPGEEYSVTFRSDEPVESLLRPLSVLSGSFDYEINGPVLVVKRK